MAIHEWVARHPAPRWSRPPSSRNSSSERSFPQTSSARIWKIPTLASSWAAPTGVTWDIWQQPDLAEGAKIPNRSLGHWATKLMYSWNTSYVMLYGWVMFHSVASITFWQVIFLAPCLAGPLPNVAAAFERSGSQVGKGQICQKREPLDLGADHILNKYENNNKEMMLNSLQAIFVRLANRLHPTSTPVLGT